MGFFRGMTKGIKRAAGLNPLSFQAQGMMSALNGRQGGGSFNYIDDSLPATSSYNPQMQAFGAGLGKGGALGMRALPTMEGDAPTMGTRKRLAGMMVGQGGASKKGFF